LNKILGIMIASNQEKLSKRKEKTAELISNSNLNNIEKYIISYKNTIQIPVSIVEGWFTDTERFSGDGSTSKVLNSEEVSSSVLNLKPNTRNADIHCMQHYDKIVDMINEVNCNPLLLDSDKYIVNVLSMGDVDTPWEYNSFYMKIIFPNKNVVSFFYFMGYIQI
jgi:hypothetical protein